MNIKQQVKYDDKAILQQVMIFSDEYQKIQEYISNSTDSASDFFDPLKEEYKKDIEIEIIKIGGKKKERKIIIKDNCSGMLIRPDKPLTIFKSIKRNNPKYSGMFGMGSFSGLSFCNRILFKTKRSNSNIIYSFEITPKTFKRIKGDNMEVDIKTELTSKSDKTSWTIVTLSDFHSGAFEDIELNKLKNKIEDTIEQILMRKGISIYLIEDDKPKVKCEPFKYSDYCSRPYVKTIDTLYLTHSKKYKTKKEISIAKTPIKMFIIASEHTNLNRELYISAHGHKVNDLSKIDQFRTNNKSKYSSKPNVGGYIDVTEVLIPTPTRKDFIKTKLSKAFFHTLNMYEPEIIEYIDSVSKVNDKGKLRVLESKINSVLQNFGENQTDNGIEQRNNQGNNEYKEFTLLGYKIKEPESTETDKKSTKKKPIIINLPPRINKKRERNNKFIVKYPSQSIAKGLLTLRINTSNNPFKDINGKELRSTVRDSKIIVFQKHPEFQNRLTQSLKGFYVINERIIHYITMEIITQLRNINNESSASEPENIIEDFVTSVLKLEEELKTLVGERI